MPTTNGANSGTALKLRGRRWEAGSRRQEAVARVAGGIGDRYPVCEISSVHPGEGDRRSGRFPNIPSFVLQIEINNF